MNSDELKKMIDGCIKKQPAAQEQLYRHVYPAMFSLCKKFFTENHDILTALNNGMLRVFENIQQYELGKGDFFTWAYSVVRNASLTFLRDKKIFDTIEISDNIMAALIDNPFDDLDREELYFQLKKLPADTRAVCTLFYTEGFTIKEIAASLEMKEGTVKWQLSESRRRLKNIFEKNILSKRK